MALLRYGIDAAIQLELADGSPPTECGSPRGQPLEDLPSAVAEAVAQPLAYPPLAQSTTPGDRVVLALDHGIPRTAEVTAAAIRAVVAAGVDPDGITVLRSPADVHAGAEDPCRLLEASLTERVTMATYDPTDRRALAYLAASETGEPILISRALHEADVVLPIGCLRRQTAAGYFGIHGSLYPGFSDAKTLARFRSPGSLDDNGRTRRQLAAESNHVAWLLGVNFTLQLVPGAGQRILHVLAGQSEAVARRGRQLYDAAWSGPVARRASLVVAAIEGDAAQQTWQNLGWALSAALALVEDDGEIAVCCELAAEPGPGVQAMVGVRSRAAAVRTIGKQRPDDALPAAELARALDHGKVYLLSRLDPALVEDLEIVPIAGGAELARLARRHRSAILLANAPRAMVTVADDEG